MKEHEKSRVWLFGDNVNTDLMSPGYTWNMEWSEAKKHILVNHPRFAPEVREGDIIVAGDNFGCGSSREAAPQNLLKLGIKAVVARSFARIFFRNSIALGLPVIVSRDAASILKDGDLVSLDIENDTFQKEDGMDIGIEPYSGELLDMIKSGGMMSRLKAMKEKGEI